MPQLDVTAMWVAVALGLFVCAALGGDMHGEREHRNLWQRRMAAAYGHL
jgi:hypothetical protein